MCTSGVAERGTVLVALAVGLWVPSPPFHRLDYGRGPPPLAHLPGHWLLVRLCQPGTWVGRWEAGVGKVGMFPCFFRYFCPKWWPLVLLASLIPCHHLIWQQGHQQAPGRPRLLPEMSPDLGPSSQLLGPIPMIRSPDSLQVPPRSCRDLPGPPAPLVCASDWTR